MVDYEFVWSYSDYTHAEVILEFIKFDHTDWERA